MGLGIVHSSLCMGAEVVNTKTYLVIAIVVPHNARHQFSMTRCAMVCHHQTSILTLLKLLHPLDGNIASNHLYYLVATKAMRLCFEGLLFTHSIHEARSHMREDLDEALRLYYETRWIGHVLRYVLTYSPIKVFAPYIAQWYRSSNTFAIEKHLYNYPLDFGVAQSYLAHHDMLHDTIMARMKF